MEEPGAYVSTRATAHEDASQSRGWFYAHEFGRFRAEVHREPPASRGHLENPPSVDLELGDDAWMNGLGLADRVPKLWFELINHRPEQGSTEALVRLDVAGGGRFQFPVGYPGQVFPWQPSHIIEAVALPARRSGGSNLEVIHLRID
jgi:hypothetical protein